jgi:serine/threonine protein phosphatase PrpC
VDVLPLSEDKQQFLLAASDGLWDARQPLFVAKHFVDEKGLRAPVSQSCFDIIEIASPKNAGAYRDDITVIAMGI